ncbi:MAG: hypothetical protein U1E33_01700 [Rhodospirillales bacterium]
MAAPGDAFPRRSTTLHLVRRHRLYERESDADGAKSASTTKGEVHSVLLSLAQFRLQCWHIDALVVATESARQIAAVLGETLAGSAGTAT